MELLVKMPIPVFVPVDARHGSTACTFMAQSNASDIDGLKF